MSRQVSPPFPSTTHRFIAWSHQHTGSLVAGETVEEGGTSRTLQWHRLDIPYCYTTSNHVPSIMQITQECSYVNVVTSKRISRVTCILKITPCKMLEVEDNNSATNCNYPSIVLVTLRTINFLSRKVIMSAILCLERSEIDLGENSVLSVRIYGDRVFAEGVKSLISNDTDAAVPLFRMPLRRDVATASGISGYPGGNRFNTVPYGVQPNHQPRPLQPLSVT
ncbi:hypothetical protein CBL_11320 [Carabus blaptoides fortunei]